MIHFHKISMKNFLSIGNQPIEVQFDNFDKTLVMGTNGTGKSGTVIDSLNFALFGKPFRKIRKPELVNAINEKDMRVELEFNIGDVEYKVVRGLYPSVFEIWQNGTLINQDAKAKDYQKVLEQIVSMNEKTFRQIVVLGSSSYIPFMRLTTGDRRIIMDNLLDIGVFTNMRNVVKSKLSDLKDEHQQLKYDIDIQKNSLEHKKSHLDELNTRRSSIVNENKEKLESLNNEIETYWNESVRLQEEADSIDVGDIEKVRSNIKELNDYNSKIQYSLKDLSKNKSFFQENDSCPTCSQSIDQSIAESKVSEFDNEIGKKNETISMIEKKHEELNSTLNEMEEKKNQKESLYRQVKEYVTLISTKKKYKKEIEETIARYESDNEKEIEQEIESLEVSIADMEKKFDSLDEEVLYYNTINDMLKDEGIKTQIIKNYIPILNRLIRKYLDIIEFNIDFTFDENFNETIKSRGRDEFSYSQLSEGEKLRIDIVLLFSFKELAKIKNSASTNLLILDEMGNNSLDESGFNSLMTILNSAAEDNTNIFFIGHGMSSGIDHFDRLIEFSKNNYFTTKQETVL